MKPNCNKLSIGEPGTKHIRWECAGAFIARNMQARIANTINLWTGKKSRRPQPNRASAIEAQPSVMRRLLPAVALVLLSVSLSHASLLTATVTNQLTGLPDTNVIRAIPLNDFTPVLADGTWVSKGTATRITPNTNGTFRFWSAPGFWAFTNVNGLNITVGFYDTSSNATAYVISGGRNFYGPSTITVTNVGSTATAGLATNAVTATNAPDGNRIASLAQIASSNYLQSVAASNYLQSVAASNYLQSVAASNYLQSVAASNYITSAGFIRLATNAVNATNAPDGNIIASLNQATNIAQFVGGTSSLAITNSAEALWFTNGYFYQPGFGWTNWPSSTTCGLQEYVNQFPWNPLNPLGGVNIRLASPAGSNYAAVYNITNPVTVQTHLRMIGNGANASVIFYRGSSVGVGTETTNLGAMILTVTNRNARYSANAGGPIVKIHDVGFLSGVDGYAALVKLQVNWADISGLMFGLSNALWTNFVTTMHFPAGNMSTASRKAIGLYLNCEGNNFNIIKDCTFNDLANGLVTYNADWGRAYNLQFGAIACVNGSTFTNAWPTGSVYHVGAGILFNNGFGHWDVYSPHFLQNRTCIYANAYTGIMVYSPYGEGCNYYSLGSLPDTFNLFGSFGAATFNTVDANYNPNGIPTDDGGAAIFNGYLIGRSYLGADDQSWAVKDYQGNNLILLPGRSIREFDGFDGSLCEGAINWSVNNQITITNQLYKGKATNTVISIYPHMTNGIVTWTTAP